MLLCTNPLLRLLIGLTLMLWPTLASAEAMRLGDPTPRTVLVEFETSSSDHPDVLDGQYSTPYPAELGSDAHGNAVVRISSEILEQKLFRARRPVPGSFSDYVWVLDRETGDVLSASFSGIFRHLLNLGVMKTDIEARVDANMTTTSAGGFMPPSNFWGNPLRRFCDDQAGEACTLVPRHRYDPGRGYVNAVGFLHIDSRFLDLATFSAVGEARFSELADRPQEPARELPPTWVAERETVPVHALTVNARNSLVGVDVAAPPPIE